MNITVSAQSLVLLIGTSSAGKSSFAQHHFDSFEVVSSDYCRALVSNDENDQNASKDAFDLLHQIVEMRLKRALFTVVDATNLERKARRHLLKLAKQYHIRCFAIILDPGYEATLQRHRRRADRGFDENILQAQYDQLVYTRNHIQQDGFRQYFILDSEAAIASASFKRRPMAVDRREDQGPFDIIGDIHGCFDELYALLGQLGYHIEQDDKGYRVSHNEGRRVCFVGDLIDRGPGVKQVLQLAMDMQDQGMALCVQGNHENKLRRYLEGKDPKQTHGFAETVAQLADIDQAFKERLASYIKAMTSHYVFDHGQLVVAHAGLKRAMQGRESGAVYSFAQYGETTGEKDENGFPIRLDWAQDYQGDALVVYGHTPVDTAQFVNNTICIDTGCVFGGSLTALRYPERELISVAAKDMYWDNKGYNKAHTEHDEQTGDNTHE